MATSQTTFLSDILDTAVIPNGKLAYFRARMSNRLHSLILDLFVRLEKEKKLTRAQLATRIGKNPAQITRWFASPGNWEADTLSDLLLGMGCELQFSASELASPAVNADTSTSQKVVPKKT